MRRVACFATLVLCCCYSHADTITTGDTVRGDVYVTEGSRHYYVRDLKTGDVLIVPKETATVVRSEDRAQQLARWKASTEPAKEECREKEGPAQSMQAISPTFSVQRKIEPVSEPDLYFPATAPANVFAYGAMPFPSPAARPQPVWSDGVYCRVVRQVVAEGTRLDKTLPLYVYKEGYDDYPEDYPVSFSTVTPCSRLNVLWKPRVYYSAMYWRHPGAPGLDGQWGTPDDIRPHRAFTLDEL